MKMVTVTMRLVETAPRIATATLVPFVDTVIQPSLNFNCASLLCPLATSVIAMKCARVLFALVGTAVNAPKMTNALLINTVNGAKENHCSAKKIISTECGGGADYLAEGHRTGFRFILQYQAVYLLLAVFPLV